MEAEQYKTDSENMPEKPTTTTEEVRETPTAIVEDSVEPPPPSPKSPVRIKRKLSEKKNPHMDRAIVIPEMDDHFFANLLRTQREAKKATRLQRIREFRIL